MASGFWTRDELGNLLLACTRDALSWTWNVTDFVKEGMLSELVRCF